MNAGFGAGWQVNSGGMTLTSGGMTIVTGGINENGNVVLQAGTLSFASPSTTSGLDVYASVTSFTGNVIRGAVTPATSSLALQAREGANSLFTVSGEECVGSVLYECVQL